VADMPTAWSTVGEVEPVKLASPSSTAVIGWVLTEA